ncbi:MAG: LysM peptidoglycan-binding domain-containing protein [Bacteroidia bacterium]|nr:LysM peptidoglycan-binding domain-containing protein [Bacteroidia bacterium]
MKAKFVKETPQKLIIIVAILFGIFLQGCSLIRMGESSIPESFSYEVQQGDNIYIIARKYLQEQGRAGYVSVTDYADQILDYNDMDTRSLYEGDVIEVPNLDSPSSSPNSWINSGPKGKANINWSKRNKKSGRKGFKFSSINKMNRKYGNASGYSENEEADYDQLSSDDPFYIRNNSSSYGQSRYSEREYNRRTRARELPSEKEIFYDLDEDTQNAIVRLDMRIGEYKEQQLKARRQLHARLNRTEYAYRDGASRGGNDSERNARLKQRAYPERVVRWYRVKGEDTLHSIARKFGNTPAELYDLNELDSRFLRRGKILKVLIWEK